MRKRRPSGVSWKGAAPRPNWDEASVMRIAGRESSKKQTTAGEVKASFVLLNAESMTSSQMKIEFLRMSFLRSKVRAERSGRNLPSWVARPRNARTSVFDFGVGKSEMDLRRLG